MAALTSIDLAPFFAAHHRELADALAATASTLEAEAHGQPDGGGAGAERDPARLARSLGERHGLYRHLVPRAGEALDVRALVLVREALGYADPLADALFAVQGLGSYPIVIAGSTAQKEAYLPDVVSGARIAAFALTEPEAGSDVSAISTHARADGGDWVLDGEKIFISNVPIAHHYVVFARAEGATDPKKNLSAFLVEQDTPGLELESQPLSIDHPIGKLTFRGARVPGSALLGRVGDGMRIALATLEAFRVTVGAAANGMANAALHDALRHVSARRQFGKLLSEQQLVQGYLADMATELDASRLLVLRAAWLKDTSGGRTPSEVAMAKMYATEAAQRTIDRAVQLLGGRGVLRGTRVEALYREVRPLRIYEGTTEIQKLIIARALLAERA
ncbi:MAG: acyl-CoA dehydrogenase family protein [Myxococcales bacterium]|nr:acyl-CoA dehydrogenase family protein [Myxococcales bacterium]